MVKSFFKPTKGKIIIFIILITLGVLDWINIFTPCVSPIFPKCHALDATFEWIPDATPGLYPPLLFDEGCRGDNKITNFAD